MPAKNVVKEYESGGYYHVYNRGVEKREIFLDDEDYKKFIGDLKIYLTPIEIENEFIKNGDGSTISPSKSIKNFYKDVDLIAYCLMPNHFHLLIKQNEQMAMAKFMQAIITKYVRFFNLKYKRVGGLFQGVYKTVRIINESQFTYITKYIHRNPLPSNPTRSHLAGLQEYKYSSYGNYLGLFKQSWVKTEDILHYFSASNMKFSYQNFVEETGDISRVYKEMIDLDE